MLLTIHVLVMKMYIDTMLSMSSTPVTHYAFYYDLTPTYLLWPTSSNDRVTKHC